MLPGFDSIPAAEACRLLEEDTLISLGYLKLFYSDLKVAVSW